MDFFEKSKKDYKNKREAELSKEIEIAKTEKVRIPLAYFLTGRIIDASLKAFYITFLSLIVGVLFASMSYFIFKNIPLCFMVCIVSVISTFIFSVNKKVECIDLKNIRDLENKRNKLIRYGYDLEFADASASAEMLSKFKREMGKQALVEAYFLNQGSELSNGKLLCYYKKHNRDDFHENTKFRLLYEDCIQKAELY